MSTNQIRDKMLKRAIGECNEPPILLAVAAHLPKDFGLDEAELAEALSETTSETAPADQVKDTPLDTPTTSDVC